ncbi:MAG: response regulator transcription factor [Candidatus Parcubacteria bacterium]|nr:response regulator transcription factor [Burkholderiales bacterium]
MHRILIVDDHPLYREGLMSALRAQMADVDVVGADSAEEGLRLLDSGPEADLVLLDLRLPGMDGFTALPVYGARFPMVPRVLVSGSDEPGHVKRAFELGASGFIPKSLSVTAVAGAIRKVLEGGTFVPESNSTPMPVPAGGELTLRQLEVLRLLGEGYANKEIARALDISERTAKAHVRAIFEALGADNRTQAVIVAQRRGLLAAVRL